MNNFKPLILETLSFFDPMTIEQILLDVDTIKIQLEGEFTLEDLKSILEELEKNKLIKSFGENQEKTYIRIMPKKGLLQKIKSFIKKKETY